MLHMYYFVITSIKLSAKKKNRLDEGTPQENLRLEKNTEENNVRNRSTEKIIHNFPSYILSEEKKRALSFSLDDNIPTKLNENKIQTDSESFYWQLLQHTKYLRQQE